jgi:hypothetical protein
MAEGVYRIDALRDQVVALLRKEKTATSRAEIAAGTHLPLWAVDAGLEAALAGELVEFAAGQGYWIKVGPSGVSAQEKREVGRVRP